MTDFAQHLGRAAAHRGSASLESVMPLAEPAPVLESAATAQSGLDAPPPVSFGEHAWASRYRRIALATDLVVGALASTLGCLIRFGDQPRPAYLFLSVSIPFVWVLTVAVAHGYEGRYMGVGAEEYRALLRAAAVLVALLAFVSFAGQLQVARGYVVLVFPALLGLSLVARHGLRRWLLRQRAMGRFMQRAVVIGRADSVADLVREIRNAPGHGMIVVAACASRLDSALDSSPELEGIQVFSRPEDAVRVVDMFAAEVVAVASHPDLSGQVLRRLAWSLEERNVDLVVAPGILEVAGPRLSIRPVAGMPLLHVERPVMTGARRVVKGIVDRVLSTCITIAALPLLELVALAVFLDSPGPILFRQKRVGARGETFEMLKFRTMVTDAEARLSQVEGGHETNVMLFKRRDDPRVTRVGKYLRRFSLDELPQLLNVLRGDMSLVGPRPPLPQEVEKYEPDAVRRLRVRPGLTGLWQVSGRSDLSWDESLRLDLWYVDNWSLVLDVQILVRTTRAVVRGAGAY